MTKKKKITILLCFVYMLVVFFNPYFASRFTVALVYTLFNLVLLKAFASIIVKFGYWEQFKKLFRKIFPKKPSEENKTSGDVNETK